MKKVRAKKHLGQHFLTDQNIAEKIVNTLRGTEYKNVLEIGPGMGVLTQFLLRRKDIKTFVIEIDNQSVDYLKAQFPNLENRIIKGDFLTFKLSDYFKDSLAIIGNFPYNISSQIVFKTLENKFLIPEFVGMFQKEVAERIAAKPGNKTYGIISVLVQAYYTIEYLFTVHEKVFNPPPKVKSGVIRMIRKKESLACDEQKFKQLVKTGFNQRRKTLRNSLKSLEIPSNLKAHPLLNLRPEQLSIENFIELSQWFAEQED